MDSQGGKYFRYCDDILFITNNEDRHHISKFAEEEISELKLEINTDKTEERNFWTGKGQLVSNKPLQYLGFTFDGERILLRSAALAKFSNKMKRGVRLAKKTCNKQNKLRNEQGLDPKPLYKRKIYERYSYIGNRNFISYGFKAVNIMSSGGIKKQLKPLWRRLKDEME